MPKILIGNIDLILLNKQVNLVKDAVYQDDYYVSLSKEQKAQVEAFLDLLDDVKNGDFNVA